MLKLKKITSQIILVSADTCEELCRTFMRFQEHYEGSEHRGKVFTRGEFLSWYSMNSHTGAASYERDVMGFNIPSSALKPFVQGLFDPLTPAEADLVELFRYRTDEFYIIGAQLDQEAEFSALEHEICHGLYYTNPDYRDACQLIIEEHRTELTPILDYLKLKLYHPAVWDDECHAFISCDLEWLRDNREVKIDGMGPIQAKLRAVRALFPT